MGYTHTFHLSTSIIDGLVVVQRRDPQWISFTKTAGKKPHCFLEIQLYCIWQLGNDGGWHAVLRCLESCMIRASLHQDLHGTLSRVLPHPRQGTRMPRWSAQLTEYMDRYEKYKNKSFKQSPLAISFHFRGTEVYEHHNLIACSFSDNDSCCPSRSGK